MLNDGYDIACPVCELHKKQYGTAKMHTPAVCFVCQDKRTIRIPLAPAEIVATYSDLPVVEYEAMVQQYGSISQTRMQLAKYPRSMGKSTNWRLFDHVKDNMWRSGR